ncbi:MAG TPA: ABC transporter permease [Solirubrobacteraceae bacterium]|nr:ABC transporter permease [Solirubrobacteraceae bacterium]
MSALLATARWVAARNLRHAFTNPALLVPSILFPLVFLLAFAGGLSSLGDTPDFDFRSGYTSFQFVFILLQSAAFGGIFTGLGIAADFESKFARRLLLAAPGRAGILVGYVVAGSVRFAFTVTLVTVIALAAGMEVDGSAPQFAALVALCFVANAAATLYSLGYCLRVQSVAAAPAMQTPIFILLFLAPVYVPLPLLDGWIHAVASWNPLTALLEAGRGFVSGVPEDSGLAFGLAFAMGALLALWAVRGLRRAEAGEG